MLSVNGTVLRNGGVPQRMNLTLHLERLKEDVQVTCIYVLQLTILV